MPRAVDRYLPKADYDPTRSGTEFHVAKLIQSETEIMQTLIRQIAELGQQSIIDFIKELTGIDLASWGSFLDGLGVQLGVENLVQWFTDLVAAFDGIDLTTPGSILAAITGALESAINDILAAIQAATGIDLTSLSSLLDQLLAEIQTLTGLDLSALAALNPVAFLAQIADALDGIDLSNPGSVLTAIQNAADGALDGVVNTIRTLTGIDLTSFATLLDGIHIETGLNLDSLAALNPVSLLTQLQNALQGITLTAGSVQAAINSAVSNAPVIGDLATLISNLVSGGQAVNTQNLFGQVNPANLGQVHIGNIGNKPVNLIPNGSFDGAVSMPSGGGWSWDGSVDHTGKSGSGAAKVVADGTNKELLMKDGLPVTEGQQLSIRCYVKWASVVSSGSPIVLGLNGYAAGSITDQKVVASRSASPATSEWVLLQGTYTVPANVDSVRIRIGVTSTASSGTVWFDDLYCAKTNLLQQSHVDGLVTTLNNIGQDITDAVDEIGRRVLQTDFNTLLNNLGGSLAAAQTFFNNVLTTTSQINGSNITVGTVSDAVVPGITTLINNITSAFLGSGAPANPSQSDAWSGLLTQADTVTGLAAEIAKLQNLYTSGVFAADDIERSVSTNLGGTSWWSENYSAGAGYWFADGHNAVWRKSGFNDRESWCRFLGANNVSNTDYQKISIVLGGTAEANLIGNCGHNDILGRVATDGSQTYIRARFGGDGSVSISRFVNGNRLDLNSGSIARLGAGSLLTLECGKLGDNAMLFTARVNGTIVLQAIDSAGGSKIGPYYRGWGFGGRAEQWLALLTQAAPAPVRQWAAADL